MYFKPVNEVGKLRNLGRHASKSLSWVNKIALANLPISCYVFQRFPPFTLGRLVDACRAWSQKLKKAQKVSFCYMMLFLSFSQLHELLSISGVKAGVASADRAVGWQDMLASRKHAPILSENKIFTGTGKNKEGITKIQAFFDCRTYYTYQLFTYQFNLENKSDHLNHSFTSYSLIRLTSLSFTSYRLMVANPTKLTWKTAFLKLSAKYSLLQVKVSITQ